MKKILKLEDIWVAAAFAEAGAYEARPIEKPFARLREAVSLRVA